MRVSARSFFSGILVGSFFLFIFWICQFQLIVQADTTHIVISQVQIAGGGGAKDEFVELYNPTNVTINLNGWRLKDESKNGSTTSANLVASMSGLIAPHSYFLITSPTYTGSVAADLVYSASSSAITVDNTIVLYSDAGITLVDEVGMGQAADKEVAAVSTPPSGGSVLRKASDTSTAESLLPGGAEGNSGNGLDTDNNFHDFVILASSLPRNSHSPQAPLITPTPMVTVTPIPTDTPTLTPAPMATATPTPTIIVTDTPIITTTEVPTATPTTTEIPTPTLEPTNTPVPTATLTPTPMPTMTPTQMPTATPMLTPTNTPIPTLTVTPTLTAIPTITPVQVGFLQCSWKIKTLSLGFFQISFPILQCSK